MQAPHPGPLAEVPSRRRRFSKLNAEFERLNPIITELKQENYRLKAELAKHDIQALEEMVSLGLS